MGLGSRSHTVISFRKSFGILSITGNRFCVTPVLDGSQDSSSQFYQHAARLPEPFPTASGCTIKGTLGFWPRLVNALKSLCLAPLMMDFVPVVPTYRLCEVLFRPHLN